MSLVESFLKLTSKAPHPEEVARRVKEKAANVRPASGSSVGLG